jgi:hypothetical protein
MEYGSELFAGDIQADLVARAERIQTTFVKLVLGLPPSAPNAFALSELGMGSITARWAKLRLGYWLRVQTAAPYRLLSRVARSRAAAGGPRNWVTDTYAIMANYRIDPIHWGGVPPVQLPSKSEWSDLVNREVDAVDSVTRIQTISQSRSLQEYRSVKSWSRTTPLTVCSRGEKGRLGFRVVESYLDDRRRRFSALLKAQFRGGCFNTLDRLVRHGNSRWPASWGNCCSCNAGVLETILHIVLQCSVYNIARASLFERVRIALSLRATSRLFLREGDWFVSSAPSWDDFFVLPDADKLSILLGRSVGDPTVERKIDKAIKQFLSDVWRARRWLTGYVDHLSYRLKR